MKILINALILLTICSGVKAHNYDNKSKACLNVVALPFGFQSLQKVIRKGQSLKDVKNHVYGLLAVGVLPSSILLILDNDGTLTNEQMPDVHGHVSERAHSSAFVKKMIRKGVKVVIASAWDKFSVTLRTLTNLGLKDGLGLNPMAIKEIDDTLPSGRAVTGFVTGRVCSLKDCEGAYISPGCKLDTTYYRAKALTPYFVLSTEEIKAIRHVVFADDSLSNIRLFNSDIEALGLSFQASVVIFSLVHPKLEPEEEGGRSRQGLKK